MGMVKRQAIDLVPVPEKLATAVWAGFCAIWPDYVVHQPAPGPEIETANCSLCREPFQYRRRQSKQPWLCDRCKKY